MPIMLKTLFTISLLLFNSFTFADDSKNMSKGSSQISKGSILIGEGASQLFSASANGSVNFVVDMVELTGEIAEVVLISSATAATVSTTVTVSMASTAVASLAIFAGTVIDIIRVEAEGSAIVLGYLLMKQNEVLLFVSPDGSSLTLRSSKL